MYPSQTRRKSETYISSVSTSSFSTYSRFFNAASIVSGPGVAGSSSSVRIGPDADPPCCSYKNTIYKVYIHITNRLKKHLIYWDLFVSGNLIFKRSIFYPIKIEFNKSLKNEEIDLT